MKTSQYQKHYLLLVTKAANAPKISLKDRVEVIQDITKCYDGVVEGLDKFEEAESQLMNYDLESQLQLNEGQKETENTIPPGYVLERVRICGIKSVRVKKAK